MKRTWSEADIKFITKHYPEKGSKYCAEKLGKKQSAVKAKAIFLKIKRTNFYVTTEEDSYIRKNISLSSKKIAAALDITESRVIRYIHHKKLRPCTWKHYSQADIDFLKKNYKIKTHAEMGKAIGRSHDSVKFKLDYLGLKRTKKETDNIRKRVCSKTYFKTGHLPENTRHDGAISERTDSNGNIYKYIRISKAVWVSLHNYNWQKENGQVPEGKILRCRNGNQLNCDPSNWELIDRETHLELNSGRIELTDTYIINNLSRKNKELKPGIAEMPELIELKRNQLKLGRAINECNN